MGCSRKQYGTHPQLHRLRHNQGGGCAAAAAAAGAAATRSAMRSNSSRTLAPVRAEVSMYSMPWLQGRQVGTGRRTSRRGWDGQAAGMQARLALARCGTLQAARHSQAGHPDSAQPAAPVGQLQRLVAAHRPLALQVGLVAHQHQRLLLPRRVALQLPDPVLRAGRAWRTALGGRRRQGLQVEVARRHRGRKRPGCRCRSPAAGPAVAPAAALPPPHLRSPERLLTGDVKDHCRRRGAPAVSAQEAGWGAQPSNPGCAGGRHNRPVSTPTKPASVAPPRAAGQRERAPHR